MGNKAFNYASPDIQKYFGGAYVLVPQTPGAWMHDKNGKMQSGDGEDMYNVGLMALIKNYVNTHPGIDKKRIYVGGCSNGGYMSLKLILKEPNYFAAGYISALAYQSQYITDAQINSIKNVPIWFIQSKDDKVTDPVKTVVPVYERLKKLVPKMCTLVFMTMWSTYLECMVAVIIISMDIGHGYIRMPISLIQNTTAQKFC